MAPSTRENTQCADIARKRSTCAQLLKRCKVERKLTPNSGEPYVQGFARSLLHPSSLSHVAIRIPDGREPRMSVDSLATHRSPHRVPHQRCEWQEATGPRRSAGAAGYGDDLKHVVKATHRTQQRGRRQARGLRVPWPRWPRWPVPLAQRPRISSTKRTLEIAWIKWGRSCILAARSWPSCGVVLPLGRGGSAKVLRETGQVGFIRISSVLTPWPHCVGRTKHSLMRWLLGDARHCWSRVTGSFDEARARRSPQASCAYGGRRGCNARRNTWLVSQLAERLAWSVTTDAGN